MLDYMTRDTYRLNKSIDLHRLWIYPIILSFILIYSFSILDNPATSAE